MRRLLKGLVVLLLVQAMGIGFLMALGESVPQEEKAHFKHAAQGRYLAVHNATRRERP